MTTRERVVITDSDLGADEIERIAFGPDIDLHLATARTEDEVIEAARGAVGILVQWAPITKRVLTELPELRAVVRYGVGLDNVDVRAATEQHVAVSNVPDYCVEEVANHAYALIMAASRRLLDFGREAREGRWGPTVAMTPKPAHEDPIGIAGYGRIGRAIANRARAAGFPVLVFDPFLSDEAAQDVERMDSLASLAEAVNHLSLHLPGGSETDGVCDRTVIERLGPSGHLVNTARGSLVDEQALLNALNSSKLWRASLDVLRVEPPAGTSAALLAHPRVICTPHVAYLSTNSAAQLRERAARRMRELLALQASER
jgi:D-3-phosphoglycerate dehydrogenase